jgi:hypothetical protein
MPKPPKTAPMVFPVFDRFAVNSVPPHFGQEPSLEAVENFWRRTPRLRKA